MFPSIISKILFMLRNEGINIFFNALQLVTRFESLIVKIMCLMNGVGVGDIWRRTGGLTFHHEPFPDT